MALNRGHISSFPHRSTGPVLVKWNDTELGYADDRIQIEERPFLEDIRNDAFGGAAGMPSDVHFLGAIAIVSCNLNRFNAANMSAIADLDASNALTYGTFPSVGDFVHQDELSGNLILQAKNEILTYELSFLRQGRRFNVGTRHQIFSLVFECHIKDPCNMVLFTSTDGTDPCTSS